MINGRVTYLTLLKRQVSRGEGRKRPSLVRQKVNHRKGSLRRRADSTLNRELYRDTEENRDQV